MSERPIPQGKSAVAAVLLALEQAVVKLQEVRELRAERQPLPALTAWATPKEEPMSYGPVRKGRGGKVKRW